VVEKNGDFRPRRSVEKSFSLFPHSAITEVLHRPVILPGVPFKNPPHSQAEIYQNQEKDTKNQKSAGGSKAR
jgi:hypothetical protein